MSIGETIPVKGWKKKSQTCANERVNEKLRSIRVRLEEALEERMDEEQIISAMKGAIQGEEVNTAKYAKGMQAYIEEWVSAGHDKTAVARRRVATLLRESFGDDCEWDDITPDRLHRLEEGLLAAGYSRNTIATMMAHLRALLRGAYLKECHTNDSFKFIATHAENVDAIYLTKADLDKLWKLELEGTLAQARDMFFIGVYTAARYSDYSKLTMANISSAMVRYTSVKTHISSVIPAAPRLIEVLKRNGGAAPKISYSSFLNKLREVAIMAGLNDDILTTRTEGGKSVTRVKKKWQMMGTHTARRTGATLLYQSGVPASQVMMITGHKTESSFFKYIRTTKEENAMMLANNPFFNE